MPPKKSPKGRLSPEDAAALTIQCAARQRQARGKRTGKEREAEERRREQKRQERLAAIEAAAAAAAARAKVRKERCGRIAVAALFLDAETVSESVRRHRRKMGMKNVEGDMKELVQMEKDLRQANLHTEGDIVHVISQRQNEIEELARKKKEIQARVELKREQRKRPKRWRNPVGNVAAEDIDGISKSKGVSPVVASFQMQYSMATTLINRPASALARSPSSSASSPSSVPLRSRPDGARPTSTNHRSARPASALGGHTKDGAVRAPAPFPRPQSDVGTASPPFPRPQSAVGTASASLPRPQSAAGAQFPRAAGSAEAQAYSQQILNSPSLRKPPRNPGRPPTPTSPAAVTAIMSCASDMLKQKRRGGEGEYNALSFEEIKHLTQGTEYSKFAEWFIRKGKDHHFDARKQRCTLTQLQRQLLEFRASRPSTALQQRSKTPQCVSVRRGGVEEGTVSPAGSSKKASPSRTCVASPQAGVHPTVLWSPGQNRLFAEWEAPPSPAQAWQKPRSAWEKQRRKMEGELVDEAHRCPKQHVVRPEHQLVFCGLGTYPHKNHPHSRYTTVRSPA